MQSAVLGTRKLPPGLDKAAAGSVSSSSSTLQHPSTSGFPELVADGFPSSQLRPRNGVRKTKRCKELFLCPFYTHVCMRLWSFGSARLIPTSSNPVLNSQSSHQHLFWRQVLIAVTTTSSARICTSSTPWDEEDLKLFWGKER